MTYLIDRQAAIDALSRCQTYLFDTRDTDRKISLEDAEYVIEKLPSAQPEIIHCADCKWFQCNMRPDGYLPKGVEEYECRHWCGWCDPVDFCSYAERRTDE